MSPAPRWSEVTALFGGAFDPPHLGHRAAVAGLFERPGIKKVLVLPTPSPKYKPCVASVPDRVEMTKLCFGADWADSGFPASEVAINLCEVERAQKNVGALTYTFDTLSTLRSQFPKLAFCLGADQLTSMDTWYQFPEVLKLSHWIVLARKPDGIEIAHNALKRWEQAGIAKKYEGGWQITGSGTWLEIFETPARSLSSTQIREALGRTGVAPQDTLLESVSRYLMDHALYGTRKPL